MIAQFSPVVYADPTDLPSTILVAHTRYAPLREQNSRDGFEPAVGARRASFLASRKVGGYELIDEIARGGMGVVYKARQPRLNRIVALKTVLPVPFPSESAAQALRWEAEVGASLDHPGIVPVHDFGECDGRPFLCMTLVEGESLATRIHRGPLRPEEAARIVAEVAESVQYVHDCGILHRDLKPANILIDLSGRSRLIDFGLARRIDDQDDAVAPGSIEGTPSYMSPEQASGRSDLVGPASDVYSLGAVLHELLTGSPPFTGGSSGEILRKVCQDELSLYRFDQAPILRELNAICRRALRKSADERYSSAGELAHDLRRGGAK